MNLKTARHACPQISCHADFGAEGDALVEGWGPFRKFRFKPILLQKFIKISSARFSTLSSICSKYKPFCKSLVFVLKVDNTTKIDKDWATFLYVVLYRSFYSIRNTDFLRKWPFQLEAPASKFICQTFLCNASLKYPLFDVQDDDSFLQIILWTLLLPGSSNYSLTSPLNEKRINNLRHDFVTTPLLFQKRLSPNICC